jgi:ABC-type antimicrobial peptide transport system permease subunit
VGGLSRYALRSLAARPLRSFLTVAGIALGVAVLFAALATNAGIDAAVDQTARDMIGRADLRVEGFAEGGLSRASVQAIAGTTPACRPIFRRRSPSSASIR